MARAKISAFVGLNTNAFQRGLRGLRRSWRRFRSAVVAPIGRFGRTIGRTFVRGGVIMGAALVGTIKHASAFRQEMALVSTMLDKGSADVEQYTEDIIKMSAKFGMAKTALTKGLYDTLSAGIAAKDGIEFLTIATKAAIGGATDTAVAVDALTSVINAYGMSAKDAAQVSDIMFQIVKDGKISYQELAENISKLAPTAKVAGMSLEDMAAAIATVVKVEKPERAMTAIRAAMMHAAKAGEDLFTLVRKFEGKSLEDIVGAGIGKRAAQGVALLASNLETLDKEFENMRNSAGRANEAFEKLNKVRHWQRLWQTILGIITRVGIVLDKTLAPLINLITNRLNQMAETPGFKRFLERVQEATKTLVGAMVALARGGEGRKAAVQGFKLVILGIFKTAFRAGAELLSKVAPRIGALIAKGFTAAVSSPAKRMGQKSAAKKAVRDEMIAEGKSRTVYRSLGGTVGAPTVAVQKLDEGSEEFKRRVTEKYEEFKKLDFDQEMKEIADKFGIDLGKAGNEFQAGMELLKKAAEEGTKGLEEFKEATDKAEPKPEPTPAPDKPKPEPVEEDVGRGFGFSALRRIGANIIGAAGPGMKAEDKQIAATKKVAKNTETTAKETKELRKEAEKQTALLAASGGAATF